MSWIVYVLVSRVRKLTYVGITKDVEARLAQHNGLVRGGARATRTGRPWRLGAQYGPFVTRGEAQRVEARVKSMRGPARLAWSQEEAVARADQPARPRLGLLPPVRRRVP